MKLSDYELEEMDHARDNGTLYVDSSALRVMLDRYLDSLKNMPTTAIKPSCTCGAAHTSNPKHHSTWCDIKG